MPEKLLLLKPDITFKDEIASYRSEFLEAGSSMDGTGTLRRNDNPEDWLEYNKLLEKKETMPKGMVTSTQFVFVRESDRRIVGMIQIRHYFNDYLKKYGGNIGYSVRPSERRKGYAKKMLSLILPECRKLSLQKVLITCIDGNLGSERTILANGGVYENTVFCEEDGEYLKRFWITL